MNYLFDYNDGLVLEISDITPDDFMMSSFYKFYLKRYVEESSGNKFIFKDSLSYINYASIIELVRKEAYKNGVGFSVSAKLSQYINDKEIYVEKRSRLGIEIKNRESKLLDRFNEYKCVVDNSMSRKLRDKQMWDSFFMCAMPKIKIKPF